MGFPGHFDELRDNKFTNTKFVETKSGSGQILQKCIHIYHNFGKTKSLFSSLKYLLDFNLTTNEVLEFYVEVHPKEQSVMNQNWGMDNLLFFNSRGGNWELYTYKVNVKNYYNISLKKLILII